MKPFENFETKTQGRGFDTCNLNPSLAAIWKASIVCLTASSVVLAKDRMDNIPGVINGVKPSGGSRIFGTSQLEAMTSFKVNRFWGSTVKRPFFVTIKFIQLTTLNIELTGPPLCLTLYYIFRPGRDMFPCVAVEIKITRLDTLHNCRGISFTAVGVKRGSPGQHRVL